MSLLSVVLFNIYVNSSARSVQSVSGIIDFVGIYADNIFALASGDHNTVSDNTISLNKKIQNWASLLGAIVPEQKSDLLHICRRRNCLRRRHSVTVQR